MSSLALLPASVMEATPVPEGIPCGECRLSIVKPEDGVMVEHVFGGSSSVPVHTPCLGDYIDRIAVRAVHSRGRRVW